MSLNDAPRAVRVHIGFFGRRNAGKSSVVNAVTGQDLAVVSDTKGTTTDPVYKSMELLPLGPVTIIDTPGFDDEGALGELRVKKARQTLNKTDIAVLVVDSTEGLKECDRELIGMFADRKLPYIIVYNKCDLLTDRPPLPENGMYVSAKTGEAINDLKERIGRTVKTDDMQPRLVGDLLRPHDLVVLVTPIDNAAPKGRLILPQQQTIRDVLEADAMAVVVKETELAAILPRLAVKPRMVITDSQAFAVANRDTPEDIPLTSFSILMARYKGFLDTAVKGVTAIKTLKAGDKVLISEGCTHHRQCNDIGTVKLPRWLNKFTGNAVTIETTSGTEYPDDLTDYALVIHCGGCMLNSREMMYRMKETVSQGVPFTNYGTAIAYMNGILKRSLSVFPELAEEIE